MYYEFIVHFYEMVCNTNFDDGYFEKVSQEITDGIQGIRQTSIQIKTKYIDFSQVNVTSAPASFDIDIDINISNGHEYLNFWNHKTENHKVVSFQLCITHVDEIWFLRDLNLRLRFTTCLANLESLCVTASRTFACFNAIDFACIPQSNPLPQLKTLHLEKVPVANLDRILPQLKETKFLNLIFKDQATSHNIYNFNG
jgi:hypothetical protein